MEFSFNKIARLHSTAYFWKKSSSIDIFLQVLKKDAKRFLFYNFTGRQLDSKRKIPCECSKIVGNLLGEGLYWSHFIKVIEWRTKIFILLKNHFIHFSGNICVTAVLKVFHNFQKNVFTRALFLAIRALQCTNYKSENRLHL